MDISNFISCFNVFRFIYYIILCVNIIILIIISIVYVSTGLVYSLKSTNAYTNLNDYLDILIALIIISVAEGIFNIVWFSSNIALYCTFNRIANQLAGRSNSGV
jgi:hypothetical protein